MEISKVIKELVYYAETHLDADPADNIYHTNILLGELGLSHPYEGEIDYETIKNLRVPDTIILPIMEYLTKIRLMDEASADRFVTKLMGFLTPRPSEVNRKFSELHAKNDALALDYLYNLSIYNNYIAKTKVEKNLLWEAKFPNNVVEISINLSKPEKNNKDIKKLLTAKSGDKYPKCLLCKENQGFYGNDGHPARENIRIVPLKLNNEDWFMQYSPYVYYDHHCIVLSARHANMHIDKECFTCLFDFVDYNPSFFIGSNADLPIVGGSILNHEHFQGGKHILPMLKSGVAYEFGTLGETKISKLDWFNSVILLEGKNREEIISIADHILNSWIKYSDEENDILAYTDERHNTITPVVRKIADTYYMFLILRNNRCNEAHPDGIFHAHSEYHMIKKEGIGLIEAMGLFILPARLKRQIKEIEDVISLGLNNEEIVNKYNDLDIFLDMIATMKKENLTAEAYINNVCKNILENVAVFKNDEKGNNGFKKFMKEVLLSYGK